MSNADDEAGSARLPRAESVLAEDLPHGGYRAFGVAADSFERMLAMLELRLRTGDRLLFAYHTLNRAMWNPSKGITLLFPDMTVSLQGRNLDGLFAALREQKVAWVCEADRATAELASASAVVIELVETEMVRTAR